MTVTTNADGSTTYTSLNPGDSGYEQAMAIASGMSSFPDETSDAEANPQSWGLDGGSTATPPSEPATEPSTGSSEPASPPEGNGQGNTENISPLNVSAKGIQMIQEHLSTPPLTEDDGSIAPENQAMIDRLQDALANGTEITGGDTNFYMHELYERTLMKGDPYTEEAYYAAHDAAIARYGVSPFALYHPDVIEQFFPERFNLNWLKYWGRR